MKKIVLLYLFFVLVISVNAQTKNGTVYSEHPTIETTKDLMKALQNGDQDDYLSFFADSVYLETNGKGKFDTRDALMGILKYWLAFDNLEIKDAKPAYPDAIEYKKAGIWVQDWLLFTATHKKTGINVKERFHHLYHFNDAGKIDALIGYFNNDVFQEISNSKAKRENGKVYINHPYIVKVRKLVNAYMAKDIEAVGSFFDPKAVFSNSSMKLMEFITLEERKAGTEKIFAEYDKIEVNQVGYPDCIYYAKNDIYVVYSWWNVIRTKGDKKTEYPVMLSHDFNKDGKITRELAYYSTNHFE